MSILQDQFLIAMPSMRDPNFSGTVAYVCKHDEKGALGIVINRPLRMRVSEIFRQLSLKVVDEFQAGRPVMGGGPVQVDRGFVIHQSSEQFDNTLRAAGTGIKVTVSQDILDSMARGTGPRPALVALGYAGWDPGQLEAEIAANAWLNVPADPAVIFETPIKKRWAAATALLGVEPHQLSTYAGHA